MSSEVENAKDEADESAEVKKTLGQKVMEKFQIGAKFWELVLCIVCLCFFYEPARATGLGKSHLHHVGIAYTTFTGFILILGAVLLGRAIGDRLAYRTSVIISVAGSAMNLLTATLLIADRAHLTKHYFFHPNAYLMEMLTTCTIFAFINTVVFAIDAVYTFRKQDEL